MLSAKLNDLPNRGDVAPGQPIVCAMGGVRDASDEEVCALIEAALSLNMRCVGANLGRTAEFTSKIVTALVAHAKEQRLQSAVLALPTISTLDRGNGVTKLAPQRSGAWSWDGASNKSAGKRKHASIVASAGAGDNAAVTALPTTLHHMHIVAWLHIGVSEVTDDLDQRESMLGLVQLIVTSLWRSRLASEAAHEQTKLFDGKQANTREDDASEQIAAPKVVPILHLVFKDGRVATLTQSRLAIAMANQHMAAPSEYQVLQMLLGLLRDTAVLTPCANHDDCVRELASIMEHILPKGLKKSDRKAVRVVELTDTAPVCHLSARTTFGGKLINKPTAAVSTATVAAHKEMDEHEAVSQSLARSGYAGPCGCASHCGDGGTAERSDLHVVVLLNRTANAIITKGSTDIFPSLYQYVYPDKPLPGDLVKLEKKVSDMVYRGPLYSCANKDTLVSPSIAITVLQHFAYHDRLYPALDPSTEEI